MQLRGVLKRLIQIGFIHFIFGMINYFVDSKWLDSDKAKRVIFDRNIFLKHFVDMYAVRFPNYRSLEIGPYMSPLLDATNADYFDVLNTDELIERSKSENGPANLVVPVNFVGPEASPKYIPERYPVIVSSHVLEHQTDLISHLNNINEILVPGGIYIAFIPDLRYCFDHFTQPSTISQVLRSYLLNEKSHTLENFLIDRLETAHNQTIQHWKGKHGTRKISNLNHNSEVLEYLKEFENSINTVHLDVHAWRFTPYTFGQIVMTLEKLELVSLRLKELRATLPGNNEFWAVFQRINE